ncbi:hypothetical protein [Neisseria meningitidis]|uniref:hypothetical protein n=1 Tax=Neisseria meningitidis TaxID=487 RepID=UPI000E57058D|nr:hypothetical protein [Neisseria meningitidis]
MSTFFQQTAQAMIAKHIDRFPLLKLDQVIDWQRPLQNSFPSRQPKPKHRFSSIFAPNIS